ncbi:hypothetical protein DFH06DRAFT_1293279, partial [Mycena polygramma]
PLCILPSFLSSRFYGALRHNSHKVCRLQNRRQSTAPSVTPCVSTALFVLSAASVAFAGCAICPDKIKEDKVVYHLVFGDYDASLKQKFCGYEEEAEDKDKNQGYCTYNGKGTLSGSDLPCPAEVATTEGQY